MRFPIHDRVVFYKDHSQPGHHFRHITIIEKGHFEVRTYDREPILSEPESVPDHDSEVYFHDTLEQARADLKRGVEKALNEGWKLYGRK